MATELNANLLVNEVSLDGGSTWKTIICEDNSQVSGTSTATTTKTKTCGAFTGVSNEPVKISGSGVSSGDVAVNQISYQQLQIYRDALQKMKFRRRNPAIGTLGQGELSSLTCDGYFTEVTETANTGDVVKFNWVFSSTGTPDFTHTS